jgi:hypothetical protein
MWARAATIAVGLWLMAAPAVLDYGEPARTVDRVAGPVIATAAFIAVWDVARALRWANLAPAAGLVLAPWILGYELLVGLHSAAAGLVVLATTPVRGPLRQRFGGGWRAVWRP